LTLTKEMKTAIIPINFSEASENAARYAFELAQYEKEIKLLLFHTFLIQPAIADPPTIPVNINELDLGKERTQLLKEFNDTLKQTYGNAETELIVKQGSVLNEVVELIKSRSIDLIVIGVNSDDNTEDNKAISIIKTSKIPVLIVPRNTKFKKPEKIALALDHTTTLDETVIRQIKDWVKLFQSKLLIFDVLKKAEQVSSEKLAVEITIEDSFEEIDYASHFPTGDDLYQEINSFITKSNSDMLIMIKHHHMFLQDAFHHSKTKKMTFQTQVPLLILPE
jgi:nucleotide-binding universal stress UspA family protein